MDFRGKNIDLVGKLKLWFGLSIGVMLVGLISLFVFHGLNEGIDFRGGSQFTYRIPEKERPALGQEAAFTSKVKDAIDKKIEGVKVQVAGGQDVVVQTRATTATEAASDEKIVNNEVGKVFYGIDPSDPTKDKAKKIDNPIARAQVGAVIGEELRRDAIYGVLIGVSLIALWIYIRYNFAGDGLRYAVAGIIALLHDVFVLVGLFALIGGIWPSVEVDGTFIAALLTVVGYSINDSVVIFDRLRENLRVRRKDPFEKVVNDSLLETMSRSINTGLTVLIMLFILLLFGGESVFNFTLAMLVGIASGLYSSIFNASMVLVAWHRFDEKKAAQAKSDRNSRTQVTVRETPRSKAIKTR